MLRKTALLFVITFFGFISPLFADCDCNMTTTALGNGIGIGSALAIAICWTRTNSVLTSILAGFFSWLYVIYYLFIRNYE